MNNIESWINAAQLVNAASIVVLVAVTWYYATTTHRILEESEKLRKATEEQAQAVGKQAEYAEQTLKFFQRQVEDQTRIAMMTLVGSVLELKQSADYWNGRMASYGSIREITNLRLLPNEWAASLERTKGITSGLYQELQNLQRSSRAISRTIEQFSATDLTFRSNIQAQEIQKELTKLSGDCIEVFNELGRLLPPGLVEGYLDK